MAHWPCRKGRASFRPSLTLCSSSPASLWIRGPLAASFLPGVLQLVSSEVSEKSGALEKLFALAPGEMLAKGLETFFADLPLPNTLSALGIKRDHIEAAAPIAERDLAIVASRRDLSAQELLTVMETVH